MSGPPDTPIDDGPLAAAIAKRDAAQAAFLDVVNRHDHPLVNDRTIQGEVIQPHAVTPPPVHLAVPPDGKSLTPCCGRTMLKLPPYDRVTADPSRVTCQGSGEGRKAADAPSAPTGP